MERTSNCKTKREELLPLSSLAQPTSIFPLSLGPESDPMGTPHLGRRLYSECTIFLCGKDRQLTQRKRGLAEEADIRNMHKFHYERPVTDIIRKQLKLRTKELKEKNSNAFDFDTICTTSGIHLAWVKPGHLQTQHSNIRS